MSLTEPFVFAQVDAGTGGMPAELVRFDALIPGSEFAVDRPPSISGASAAGPRPEAEESGVSGAAHSPGGSSHFPSGTEFLELASPTLSGGAQAEPALCGGAAWHDGLLDLSGAGSGMHLSGAAAVDIWLERRAGDPDMVAEVTLRDGLAGPGFLIG